MFGSYVVDVLQQTKTHRIASLCSIHGERHICRTLAVTLFSHPVPPSLAAADQAIRAGASIGETLHSWEQGWWDAERNIHHVVYSYEYTDGRVQRSHLRLHMYERRWLLEKLAEHGFELIGEWEDFVGTPLCKQSLKWVVQVRKR